MKIQMGGWAAILAAALAAPFAACEVEQPPGQCTVSHLSNFAFFDPKPGHEAKTCGMLPGDFVTFSKYNPPGTEEVSISLSVSTLGDKSVDEWYFDPRLDESERAQLSATGDYQFLADDQGFCVAPDLSPAQVNVEASGGEPAANIVYKFTNLRMSGIPRAPATQWTADLVYTQDGCTAEYTVVGISPAIPCADDNGQPDNSFCEAAEGEFVCNEDHECANPDFLLTCDPDAMICRPAKEVPSFKE